MSIDITEYKNISSQLSAIKRLPLPAISSAIAEANSIESLIPYEVLNSLPKEFLPTSAMLETLSSLGKIPFESLNAVSSSLSELKDSFPKYVAVSDLMADLYKEKISNANILSVSQMLSETLSSISKDTHTVAESMLTT